MKKGNGSLLLNIDESFRDYTYEYFNGNTIIIEEDFTLPPEIFRELGIDSGYKIKSGNYQISETKNTEGRNTITF